MHRFTNSLARTEFKKEITAVEIDFQGFGSMQVYYQTLEIAAKLVMLSKKNCWLLVKNDFDDMSAYQFLTFLDSWFNQPSYKECAKVCEEAAKVALLTHNTNLPMLRETFRNFDFDSTLSRHVKIGFFADIKAANAYIKQSYIELLAYGHGMASNF